jgi:hypothetical protein
MTPLLYVLGALGMAGCVGLAAAPASGPQARVLVDRQPGRYHYTALYEGDVRDGLAYQFEVVREGASGRSKSSQGGAVQGDTLSSSAVSVNPGDRVTVRLTVTDAGQIVAHYAAEEVVES